MRIFFGFSIALIGILVITAKDSQSNSPEVIQIGKMSVDRAGHQATLLKNGMVLVTGGCAGQGCSRILSSAELYDPVSGSLSSVSPMSTPRAGHTAELLMDGRILVAGGWTGSRATNSAEIYDPSTDKWVHVGTMSDHRASLISISLSDGTVLIMGGGDGRLGNLSSVEIFDPSSNKFSLVGESRTNHYLATSMADGRILMTGGQSERDSILSSTEIYDPIRIEFEQAGYMRMGRVKHAAVLLDDGRVLVIGGSDTQGFQGRFKGTELFDPKTGLFTTGPKMQFGRHKIRDSVVKLPSGNILIAGGASKPEIFHPNTEEFTLVKGELSGPQMFATATLLNSGEVLVLGGYDERTRPTDAVWLVRNIQ